MTKLSETEWAAAVMERYGRTEGQEILDEHPRAGLGCTHASRKWNFALGALRTWCAVAERFVNVKLECGKHCPRYKGE